MTRFNAWLALGLIAVAAYWMATHPLPGYLKLIIVVGAYFAALQWLSEYAPRAAQWIGSTTLLVLLEMVRAILSMGGRRR